MITENLSTLKIHKLTKEQYQRELDAGRIDETALYLTPDEEIDLSPYVTMEQLNVKANAEHTHSIDDINNLQYSLDNILETSKTYTNNSVINKAEKTHNHDDKYDAKGAASEVQTNLDIISDVLDAHIDNTDIHVTTTNRSNWNTAYAHSQASHARADATKVADSATNGNILINGTETNVYSHPDSGVTTGTYNSVTVNAQGHVVSGSNPTTLAGYGITDAESKGAASSALAAAKEYTDTVVSGKSDTTHNHDSVYDIKGAAENALASAKSYADSAATTAANKVKNDLLNGAGDAYDTLKELGDLIDINVDTIDALEIVAAGKADKTHTHVIGDVTGLEEVFNGKADLSHGIHVEYSATAPVVNGVAYVGTATTVARSDHSHPTDTSRAAQVDLDALEEVVVGKADKVHSHDNATTSKAGFMTVDMVSKLEGIEEGANKITIDSELSATSTNPVQNKVLDAEFDAISNAMNALELAIDKKANSSHTHDDRYYTETEIDNMEFITVNDVDIICGATT